MTLLLLLRPWKFSASDAPEMDMHDLPKKKRRRELVEQGLEALKLLDIQRESAEALLYKQKKEAIGLKDVVKPKAIKRVIEKLEDSEEEILLLMLFED
jgi:type I site-specific restriction endonuclease